jgi:hypothetical protein
MCVSWELWGSNPRGNVPLGLKSNALTTRPNSHFFFLKTFIFYTVTHIYKKNLYFPFLLSAAVLCCASSVLRLLLLLCCVRFAFAAMLCCAVSVLRLLLLCCAMLCCAVLCFVRLPLRLCHKKKSERVQEEKEKKR